MSMGRKQVRLSLGELHEVKQLMGVLLAILSFWSLAALDIGSQSILLMGGAVATVAFCFPRWVARIPALVWRWAGPMILLFIGIDFMLHMPAFIPPLVRMVVLLLIYRILAPRNLREDKQLILLCLFCVVISGVLTVSLLFAFQILIFAPLAMALLFVICILDRGKDVTPCLIDWEHFEWSQLIRRVWCVLDFRMVVLCAAMFLLVVTVSSLLFILTPRFDMHRAIPFMELNSKARSGFSEEVALGEVSEIQEDNRVALRIDVPALDAVSAMPYWRMLVLDEYEGGRFRVSPSLRTKPFRLFQESRELRSPVIPLLQRSGALWTFYMEGGISRYLPLPGDYVGLRFQKFQAIELIPDLHVLALDSVGQNVFSYQVEDLQFNLRFAASDEERDALLEPSPPERVDEYASLPYPFTTLDLNLRQDSIEVLEEINRNIVGEADRDVLAYSRAVTDYLWEQFAYSLRPDMDYRFDRDPVVSWLETGSQGHCELFAGAFILLARQAGFPARMVVGYAGGTWNTLENYFVVRNRDAHAWVEIYDAATQSWLRVDPTPGRGSSDPELIVQGSMVLESGWAAWIDSLRIQWYRRIVNFEQRDQVELALNLKDTLRAYMTAIKQVLREWGAAIQMWFTRPLNLGSMLPIILIIVVGAAVYGLWRMRDLLWGLLFRMLRRPFKLDPVRRRASRLLKLLKAAGIQSQVVADLEAIRFGPEQSLSEVKAVFARARRALK
ncbi:transglutaminaseTgpA domain-containing protein [Coraliomargarita sp. SDUM461004]|uniref:TransglutaminaseTgpA domain-containing protein n=1 Tax=Thalassobacterium sedimentorum TaxID=3041258 RepID=A0ABU1AF19_9BACT|nr:transglutaminaseTgpA domain-containing protein [Coraliomargarita sp. SDUM461004]MDQ8193366.1 transglutaminaseTgpA domain-containing protein [Coraliomargarita sp. SDUM461004]